MAFRAQKGEMTDKSSDKMRQDNQSPKDVIPCSEKVEPGYFFGPGGGSIMVIMTLYCYFWKQENNIPHYLCAIIDISFFKSRFIDNSVLDLTLTLQ